VAGHSSNDATWEEFHALKRAYPHLVGKGFLNRGVLSHVVPEVELHEELHKEDDEVVAAFTHVQMHWLSFLVGVLVNSVKVVVI
jgi:hypothetical protein